MAFLIVIPLLYFCVASLLICTSFIRNRLIGSLWLVIGASWIITTSAFSKEEHLYWAMSGLLYLLIGVLILFRRLRFTYVLWTFGFLLFVIYDLIIYGDNKIVGCAILLISLAWITYRKKSFIGN